MKITLTILFIITGLATSYGQTVSDEDFHKVISYLKKEDWKSAFQKTSEILKLSSGDTSELKAVMLYMNIYSAAALVAEGKMSYKELTKNIKRFEGQKIVMAAHPVSASEERTINQTYLSSTDTILITGSSTYIKLWHLTIIHFVISLLTPSKNTIPSKTTLGSSN